MNPRKVKSVGVVEFMQRTIRFKAEPLPLPGETVLLVLANREASSRYPESYYAVLVAVDTLGEEGYASGRMVGKSSDKEFKSVSLMHKAATNDQV